MNKLLLKKIESAQFADLIDIALAVEAMLGRKDTEQMAASFDQLIAAANDCIADEFDTEKQVEMLLDFFFVEALFSEEEDQLLKVEEGLVAHALTYRSANPITLGIVMLALVDSIGLDLEAMFIPGEVLVKINLDEEQSVFVSPANGATLSLDDLSEYLEETKTRRLLPALSSLEEHEGFSVYEGDELEIQTAMQKSEGLHNASAGDVVLLYLSQLKALLIANNRFEHAFIIVETLLALQPDDPYERRDRGFMLEKMHCPEMAKADFDFFVEQCPHDPSLEIVKQQLSSLRQETQTYH